MGYELEREEWMKEGVVLATIANSSASSAHEATEQYSQTAGAIMQTHGDEAAEKAAALFAKKFATEKE